MLLFYYRNSKNMPESVREQLKNIIMVKGGKTELAAEQYILEMDKFRRFQSETWS